MILRGKGLIVPDVHEKPTKLMRILAMYESLVEWILFLGDFFDSFANFGLPSQDTLQMCQFIIEHIDDPKYKFLFGNHDVHYAFSMVPALRCSGWHPDKQRLISKHLSQAQWKHFRLLAFIPGPEGDDKGNLIGPRQWVCSHAGLHPAMLHPIEGFNRDALLEMEQIALADIQFGRIGPWLEAGRGRGGVQRVGGVDWLDWDTEFTPIDGLNQIVGHSHGKVPRVKENPNSMNLCIDTNLNHVILVDENGKIDLQEVPERNV